MGVAASGGEAGDEFMGAMMGTGIIFILLGVILSIFVNGDYSGDFANSIFTTHARPKDYIGGKLMSMAATSAIMLVVYLLESVVSLMIFTGSVTMAGTVFGLITFMAEKWLLSIAFSSMVLLVMVATRKAAWGILASFLISTGGLVMSLKMLTNLFGLTALDPVFSVTISGASALCTLDFVPMTLLRVALASGAWFAVSYILSTRLLAKKDV